MATRGPDDGAADGNGEAEDAEGGRRGSSDGPERQGVMMVELPTTSEEEWQESVQRTNEEWAKITLPAGWRKAARSDRFFAPLNELCEARRGKTIVLFSVGKHGEKWWLHVSLSHPEKIPSYMDVAEVKRIFVGKDRQAIQVFPKESEHVNLHPRCLHLWACLDPDGDGLPAFGEHGTI